MDRVNPDIEWARKISKELGIATRCQFATVEKCPRYYQSLSLLKNLGRTGIEPEKDKRLQKKWDKSHLWPHLREQTTSVSGNIGGKKNFSNCCPEVAYDEFGLFASTIIPYKDEIDHESGIHFGIKEGMPNGHWIFDYNHVDKMHYSDCPLFSPLKLDEENKKISVPWLDQIIKKIKNNPIIAIFILFSILIVGLGAFTDALTKIQVLVNELISAKP